MRASFLGPLALVGGAILLLGGVVVLMSPAPRPTASGIHFMTEAEFERRIYDNRFPSEWKGGPPAGVSALLGGLQPGNSLAESWEVRAISKVTEGSIYVDVARLPWDGFDVRIALKAQATPGLVETDKYALYVSAPRPESKHTPEEQNAVLQALQSRIQKVEASAPTPAGMTELVVRPAPPAGK